MLNVIVHLDGVTMRFETDGKEFSHTEVLPALSKCLSEITDAHRKRAYSVVLSAFKGEKKILAIKQLRMWTGLGLKEAKGQVDLLGEGSMLQYHTLKNDCTLREAETMVDEAIALGFAAHYE